MASIFHNIGILGRVKNPGVKETVKALTQHLIGLSQNFLVEVETAESLDNPDLKTIQRERIGHECDLLIVVGGDGSLLHAAHAIVNQHVPVVGINRGSLGFLTDIRPADLEKITAILQGKYTLEKRFLLTAEIHLNDDKLGKDHALNEVVIIPDSVPHMIQFEIYIDKQFVCSQNSDGLIIATPTGSTAYALSGGGPILHPQLDAIVLVPMFPHSLNNRPIVVEGNCQIDIIITPNNKASPRLSCDGRDYLTTPIGSRISVVKNSQALNLIHPLDYNYYETLRTKLHWGKKLHYSE
jgi:NAD+ kinase